VRGVNLIRSGNTWYLFNGNGDVVQLANQSGQVVRDYRYDAFGVQGSTDVNDTNPFRYGGEYFDRETGNIYLRARYYDPRTGRFTQQDPFWNTRNMIYGHPSSFPVPNHLAIMQSSNLYVYAGNNPIRYRDPSGLMMEGAPGEYWWYDKNQTRIIALLGRLFLPAVQALKQVNRATQHHAIL